MKKPMIKRRKRVLPAGQSSEDGRDLSVSPSPGPETRREKGSVNPDGSVNLGHRPKPEQSIGLVAGDVSQQTRQTPPLNPAADLTQCHARNQPQSGSSPLTDENRLAPLTSIAPSTDRQTSLSPASFLSASRKRSFSSAEVDVSQTSEHASLKRLSSIKSILNPAGASGGVGDTGEASQSFARSPGNTTSEKDAAKAQKRAALLQEAEYMRAILAAKERELAELED